MMEGQRRMSNEQSRPEDRHRLHPGQTVKIGDLPTDGKELHADRSEAEHEFSELANSLYDLQNLFYADGRHKLLVVFQAMDGGGKDGTIRQVFRECNPQGVSVHAFKAPTPIELNHDFLWRVHQCAPARGQIAIFNRSHYEDVLIVRVDRLVPESVWKQRYDQINDFEQLLADSGTTILKFFIHVSKEEQYQRFRERLDDPVKNWKFSLADVDKRRQWDDYMEAYEAVLNRCTTEYAPWYVIPGDQKWYRNWVVARILVDTLKKLRLRYPKLDYDPSSVQLR
jgi:PPK2 family polyphosphate:nucleotide phosphotransferase